MSVLLPENQWDNIDRFMRDEFAHPTDQQIFKISKDGSKAIVVGDEKIPIDQIRQFAIHLFRDFPQEHLMSMISLQQLKSTVEDYYRAHPDESGKEARSFSTGNETHEFFNALFLLEKGLAHLELFRTLQQKGSEEISDEDKEKVKELEGAYQLLKEKLEKQEPVTNAELFPYLYGDYEDAIKEIQKISHSIIGKLKGKEAHHIKMESLILKDIFTQHRFTGHGLETMDSGSSSLHWAVASRDPNNVNLVFEEIKARADHFISEAMRCDDNGLSPFLLSYLFINDPYLLSLMVKLGQDINSISIKGEPFLHYLVAQDKLTHLEKFIKEEGVDLLHRNLFGMTALHQAVDLGRYEIAERLLKEEKISACLSMRDNYGLTPLDIALAKKDDKMIALLAGESEIEKYLQSSQYGKHPVMIKQTGLIKKFTDYLTLHGREVEESQLNISGECSGLTFLHNYYCSLKKEEEFFDALEALSTWDGTQEALKSETAVEKFAGKYRDLGDLFEQWMNDIFWLQHSTPDIAEYSQSDRLNQFNVIKPSGKGIEISSQLEEKVFRFDAPSLAKSLWMLQHYNRNWCVEFSTLPPESHVMGLKIDEEGNFHFYDSNQLYRIPKTQDPELIARILIGSIATLESISTPGKSIRDPYLCHVRAYLIGTDEQINTTLENSKNIDIESFKRDAEQAGIPPAHAALMTFHPRLYQQIIERNPAAKEVEFCGYSASQLAED